MIKALIVEDEVLASKRLAEQLSKYAEDIEVVGITVSINETLKFLGTKQVDLMFLDINLSDGYSFAILEQRMFNTPPIIFTTAYSEHAIRAFKHNSISYLLKPIHKDDLLQAIEKCRHLSKKTNKDIQEVYKNLVESILKPYKERFLVKLNNTLETILIKDISYFFSEDKLTFIMLKSGRKLPFNMSLKAISEEVDPAQFYRINRKYLVHLQSIKEMYYASKSKIKIDLQPPNTNDKEINFVAIEKVGQFKKWLANEF